MQFYEKLKFLMDITDTSNRMLAQELQVDPSMISRLRTGSRRIPRNGLYIKKIASFIAGRCSGERYRKPIAEMLRIQQLPDMKREQLAEILYLWLCNETDEVGRFMRTVETLEVKSVETEDSAKPFSQDVINAVYYGNHGKRAAARAVYHHLISLNIPRTLYIFSDESDEWIREDFDFQREFYDWGMELLLQGYRICHIAPPITSAEQAFDSLDRWLPLYMTGRVDAYYYPRMRDMVHRRTIVVVPEEIAMTSNSVAGKRTVNSVFITTDRRFAQSYVVQVQDYLDLCRPMMNTYKEPEKLVNCFTRFLTTDGARIQKVATLSAETTPRELMEYCVEMTEDKGLKKLGVFFLHEMAMIEQRLNQKEFIDINYLASVEQVRAGMVPVIYSYGINPELFCYTPEMYVLHLKNILRLMENCANYHFVPIKSIAEKEGAFMVKEGQRALLVRTDYNFAAFEIADPNVVRLCREHLLNIAEQAGFRGSYRVKIMSQIKELIRELQG